MLCIFLKSLLTSKLLGFHTASFALRTFLVCFLFTEALFEFFISGLELFRFLNLLFNQNQEFSDVYVGSVNLYSFHTCKLVLGFSVVLMIVSS